MLFIPYLWLAHRAICVQDPLKDCYGDRPFTNHKSGTSIPELTESNRCRSPLITSVDRKSERIAKLSRQDTDRRIVFKARIHHARAMSKHILFLIFRQNTGTIQGVLTEGETVSQNMLLWAESIHNESIVWVEGTLQIPQNDEHEVKSSSVRDIEVKIEKVRSTISVVPTCNSSGPSYTSCLPRTQCYHFGSRMFHSPSLNWRNRTPTT